MDITYLRFANSMLEPVWNRRYVESRADHDGRGLRRGGPRQLLRPGRARCATSSRTTCCRCWPWSAMEPPSAGDRYRRDPRREARPVQGDPGRRTRSATCAASTRATATSRASTRNPIRRPSSRLRLEIENWRWSGVPFFIRAGKCLAEKVTEVRVVLQSPPQVGLGGGPIPATDEIVLRIDPDAGRQGPARGEADGRGEAAPGSPRPALQAAVRRSARALRASIGRCARREPAAVRPRGQCDRDLADRAAADRRTLRARDLPQGELGA